MTTNVAASETAGGRLRLARSRGAVPGVILIVLGAWAALSPLVGGYFDFGFAPDDTWNLTPARWWLEVLPGIVVILGGLLLVLGSDRITTSLGGWLGAAGGAWLAVGATVQPVTTIPALGQPLRTDDVGVMATHLLLTIGLGVVVVFVSAWALGALAVVGVRDVRRARERESLRDYEDRRSAEAEDARRRSDEAEDARRRSEEAGRVRSERVTTPQRNDDTVPRHPIADQVAQTPAIRRSHQSAGLPPSTPLPKAALRG